MEVLIIFIKDKDGKSHVRDLEKESMLKLIATLDRINKKLDNLEAERIQDKESMSRLLLRRYIDDGITNEGCLLDGLSILQTSLKIVINEIEYEPNLYNEIVVIEFFMSMARD